MPNVPHRLACIVFAAVCGPVGSAAPIPAAPPRPAGGLHVSWVTLPGLARLAFPPDGKYPVGNWTYVPTTGGTVVVTDRHNLIQVTVRKDGTFTLATNDGLVGEGRGGVVFQTHGGFTVPGK